MGNVLTVVNDIKLPLTQTTGTGENEVTVIVSYRAVVVSATDYSPFGVALYGRSWSNDNYRYGFNGKEKDKEGMGGGNQTYDYGFRIYNPALAKFLSVDPLSASYPWYTPYQFAGNKPIIAIDLDGLEELDYNRFLEGLKSGYKLLMEIPFPEVIEENDLSGRTANDGWRINQNNQFWSLEGSTYSMKEGVSPSAALQDMVNNPDNYTIDCAQFIDMQRLYGMRNSMGNEGFDNYIEKQGRGKFKIQQHNSTGVNDYMTHERRSSGNLLPKGGWLLKSARERIFYDKLPIGSRLWIGSIGYEKNAWGGENLVKVGRNRYNAQGIGENMTLRQIKRELHKKQTPIEGVKQKISVELVQEYKGNLNESTNDAPKKK